MCLICERIKNLKKNPHFIHEFKHSIFVLGDHQFFQGYSLLFFKEHVRDVTELSPEVAGEFFKEVVSAGKIIQKHFQPYRLNYSCLGNQVEHIHFHIFPRYTQDLEQSSKSSPWFFSNQFNDHLINADQAIQISKEIKKGFSHGNMAE